jgi:hypothetical protein
MGWRVHRICCRVTIRRDTISFTVDSTNAAQVGDAFTMSRPTIPAAVVPTFVGG